MAKKIIYSQCHHKKGYVTSDKIQECLSVFVNIKMLE